MIFELGLPDAYSVFVEPAGLNVSIDFSFSEWEPYVLGYLNCGSEHFGRNTQCQRIIMLHSFLIGEQRGHLTTTISPTRHHLFFQTWAQI